MFPFQIKIIQVIPVDKKISRSKAMLYNVLIKGIIIGTVSGTELQQ